jgi:hypothetical protein
MYKAFTAIALKKINFPGKNSTKNSCKVYRVVNRTALNERYNTYAQSKKAGKNVLISHQVGESTSICGPLDWIFEGTLDKEPTPKDIHEFEVPFFRVLAAYFLHLFDDNPEYKKKGWKDSAGEIVPGVGFWDERELVCNLNGISAKVKEAENSINTWAFPVEIVRIEKEKVELKINNKMAIIAKPSDKSLLESGFVYLGTPNTDNTKWEDLISCAISDRGMVKGFTNDTRLVDIGRKLYNGKALDLQPGTEICYYYTYDNDDDTKYYVVAKKDPSIVLEEDPSIFPEEDFAIFDEEDEGE